MRGKVLRLKKLHYIDQLVGPTSLDIINALSNHAEVHLHTGGIIKTYAGLDSRVVTHQRAAYNKNTFSRRLFSWFAFYFTTVPSVIFRKKDVLFLVSNPPLNFLFGFAVARMFKLKYHLLLWDIYPDIIVQSKYVSANSTIVKIWSRLNRQCLKSADSIFTISENLAAEIRKYLPSGVDNIRIVPNWVNSDEIKPIPKDQNAFILRQNLQDKFIVMYSGNMGQTHDLETIVEAAKHLSQHTDIHFVLIGDGAKRAKLVKMVEDWKLQNIRILPFQEPDMFKFSIASADVGFVTTTDGFETYSVPSKTYYLMAAGCIVVAIANEKSELNNLIRQHEFGYRFDPGNAVALAANVLKIY
ncbi:MAG TPA: glycosyltransferase family 4 protein, partial [Cyclobacteriaceae bacterium]|nr:glycosyltransferase family 4 protein [Cyclobacteriaceae bacterium]